MLRKLFLFVGIASILVLGAVILWRPGSGPDPSAEELEPEAKLELFLNDRMDYSLKFSRLLAERRIRSAESLAVARPDLQPLAREVVDSLRSRLARTAP